MLTARAARGAFREVRLRGTTLVSAQLAGEQSIDGE